MKIRFGPPGLGSIKEAEESLERFKENGFEACEIAFTHGVYMKDKDDARRIGKKAKEEGIRLSIHAPYYINLSSPEKVKREASKKRILDCCEIGEILGVEVVVFHPGFYGKETNKEKIYGMIRDEINEMQSYLKKKGWKIKLAPETTGKINVFGSLEEISRLVKDTGCLFTIDFAHILAREKAVNYDKITKLFPGRNWHCHFSGIVYNEKGERHHKTTEKNEWEELFANLEKVANDKDIVIINESPTATNDLLEGIKILKE